MLIDCFPQFLAFFHYDSILNAIVIILINSAHYFLKDQAGIILNPGVTWEKKIKVSAFLDLYLGGREEGCTANERVTSKQMRNK